MSISHPVRWMLTLFGCIGLAILAGVWGFQAIGLYGEKLVPKQWAAIGAALVVLVIKYVIPAVRSKGYKGYEQGYDAFLWAAGVALPGFGAAYVAHDSHAADWGFAIIVLIAGLFISLGVVVCAEKSPLKANGKPGYGKIFWTLCNYFLGTTAFVCYILFLVIRAK